jgi:hypothetical protein
VIGVDGCDAAVSEPGISGVVERQLSASENLCPIMLFHASFVARGTRYPRWSRHYAVSRKVAGPRPDEVTQFFFPNLPNPSSRTLALGFTEPVPEIIPRRKGGKKSVGLTTFSPSVSRSSRQCGILDLSEPVGPHGLCPGQGRASQRGHARGVGCSSGSRSRALAVMSLPSLVTGEGPAGTVKSPWAVECCRRGEHRFPPKRLCLTAKGRSGGIFVS